jgi:glycosyltransferase involved in cell wall biosynthesis
METPSPRITVLMPIYNNGLFLQEAISSILNQSFGDFELLLIDDASADNSSALIRSFTDPRIRFIQNEKNLGLIGTLNKGISLARGEFIARMDGDDISLPDRFAKQLNVFETHPDASIVASPIVFINSSGIESGLWQDDRDNTSPAAIARTLAKTNCLAHPSVLGRSTVFRKYKYDERQIGSEDWDLWMRIVSDGGKIYKTSEVLLRYRIHGASMTALLRKQISGEAKMIGVKKRFLLSRFAAFKTGAFEFRVFYSLLRAYARNLKLNILPPLLVLIKRLLSISWFKANAQYKMLEQEISQCREHSGVFLFFPYMQMGGAEKVHAAITEALSDQQPWVFIAGFAPNASMEPLFRAHSKVFDIPHATNHPFYAAKTRLLIGSFVEKQQNPRILGCANYLFFDLAVKMSSRVKCIDLKHDFRLDLDVAIEKKLLPVYLRMDLRIFISNRAIAETKKYYALNDVPAVYAERIRLILNAVYVPDQYPLKHPEAVLKVLYAGRGTAEKRAHIVCRLAEAAHRQKLPFVFSVAGDLSEAVNTKEYPYIHFIGEVKKEAQMRQLYTDTDVVLITSRREGFPMVIMEGMAHGAVPLSTPVGDIPRHLEAGKNGFVTQSIEEEEVIIEMIARLTQLAADRMLLAKVSANAYSYAKSHFQEDVFVESYRSLFGLAAKQ